MMADDPTKEPPKAQPTPPVKEPEKQEKAPAPAAPGGGGPNGGPPPPLPPGGEPGKKEPAQGLESIKRHKPQQSFDMKGPGGSDIRKDAAAAVYQKDWEKTNSDRGAKYANIEKKAIADRNDVREDNKDKIKPDFDKSR